MEAVKKAKYRVSQFPGLVKDCRPQAVSYANCVLKMDDVKLNDCQNEFKNFMKCLKNSAVSRKIRI